MSRIRFQFTTRAAKSQAEVTSLKSSMNCGSRHQERLMSSALSFDQPFLVSFLLLLDLPELGQVPPHPTSTKPHFLRRSGVFLIS